MEGSDSEEKRRKDEGAKWLNTVVGCGWCSATFLFKDCRKHKHLKVTLNDKLWLNKNTLLVYPIDVDGRHLLQNPAEVALYGDRFDDVEHFINEGGTSDEFFEHIAQTRNKNNSPISPPSRRFSMFFKINSLDENPLAIDDLNLQDYNKLKNNDEYTAKFISKNYVFQNEPLTKLWRSQDEKTYHPVCISMIECDDKKECTVLPGKLHTSVYPLFLNDKKNDKRSSDCSEVTDRRSQTTSTISSNNKQRINSVQNQKEDALNNPVNSNSQPLIQSRTESIPKTKRQSVLWNHAKKVTINGIKYHKCAYCPHKTVDCNNTSNMLKHLRVAHALYLTNNNGPSASGGSNTANNKKRAAEEYGCVQNSATKKPCVSKTPTVAEVFENIESFQGGQKAEEMTEDILFMMCRDMQPISLVENEGFQYFVKKRAPHYKMPSAKTATRRIEARYEVQKQKVVERLGRLDSYCITADVWTDNSQMSYLGVSAHFLDPMKSNTEDIEMESIKLGCTPLHGRHTADYLETSLRETFKDFGIVIDKISALITDAGSAILKAAEAIVTKNKHIICLVHKASHVLPDSIEKDGNLDNILVNARKIIKIIKRCGPAAEKLEELQLAEIKKKKEELSRKTSNKESFSKESEQENTELAMDIGETPLKLILDVKTRFTSTVDMIERYLLLDKFIYQVVREVDKPVDVLNIFEKSVLSDALNIMRPIRQLLTELSAEKCAISGFAFPTIHYTLSKLEAYKTNTPIGEDFKKKVVENFKIRLSSYVSRDIFVIPTILDPRFKTVPFKNFTALVSKSLTRINNELIAVGETNEQNSGQTIHVLAEQSGNKENIWNYHETLKNELEIKKQKSCSYQEAKRKFHWELDHYLNSPFADKNDNIFSYWIKRSAIYPSLSKIALKRLAILVSSIPSERLFSLAGNIKSEKRNRLTGKHLNMLAFLSSFTAKEWFA